MASFMANIRKCRLDFKSRREHGRGDIFRECPSTKVVVGEVIQISYSVQSINCPEWCEAFV
ncbi:hypothetical protein CISG_09033 [Coccidioides immitis RMSCC 3703]|uniref:Uncharacterized protein n=1 Tax=Coccidioides immitis RMSCC 3703 TaxID=454286 RepID=A0A0J8U3P6_COCIT|nr:hypothetical protein CISG_09033 [Coccidioides immitis RMSCC 3703]